MEQDKICTYEEVKKSFSAKKRQKYLLLGNGFSVSYDSGIFSYNALSKFLETLDKIFCKNYFRLSKQATLNC